MATDTTQEGAFGRVSRLRGVLFEYATLAASLVGIVALAVFLARVVVDALGLAAASTTWYLLFVVTLVLPTLGFAAYGRRRPGAARVGGEFLVRLLGGTALGVGIVILFVVGDAQLWFLAYTVSLFPTAAVVLYGRYADDPRVGFPVPHLLLPLSMAAAVLLKGPIDTYPTDWLIYLWTLVVPVAAGVGFLVARRRGGRVGATAGVAVAGFALVASLAGAALTGFDAKVGLVFALTPVVPAALFVERVAATRREDAAGLLLPVVLVGGVLLGALLARLLGVDRPEPWLDWQFLTSAPSRFAEQAGLYPAIIGSVFVIALVAVLSFVLGVGTAIYLAEYAPESGLTGRLAAVIQVNISNLAGVPSVVYGLLGLGVFVNLLSLGFGSVLVAAMTLALLILPIVVISAHEAIQSVPDSMRQASYGMGATRWQTVRNVVLPEALPGILTGTILALGRAIGETAPLIMIGAPTSVFSAPKGLFEPAAAMPMQIFAWAFFPKEAFRHGVVAASIVTLLAVLLTMNGVAILVRNKYQRQR